MSETYPYEIWRGEQGESGHKAEEFLETFFKKYSELGLIQEVSEKEFGKKLDKDAFFRTKAQTDYEEGWDFGYYDETNNAWHKIDLTTMADYSTRRVKEEKNKKAGVKTIFLPLHVLKNASLSSATTEDPNKYQLQVLNELRTTLRQ